MPSEFAAAQQRVLARQQEREAQHRARLQVQRDQFAASRAGRLPLLGNLGQRSLETWNLISGREGTRPAYRVGQVDAELLDDELLELLKGQIGDGLKFIGPHLLQDWSAEIVLALRAVLFKLSIWDNDASYGAALQGLKYTDARRGPSQLSGPTKWQKSLYGLVTVAGRYSWEKWEEWLIGQETGQEQSPNFRLLSRLSSLASTAHDMASLLSFAVFLLNGRYRTLTDRLLRMRLVPPSNQISREISFEYLNRQLVWHAFTEFLLFLLPLVGITRWKRWLARAWTKAKGFVQGTEQNDEPQGELAFLPERSCAICYQDQNPTSTSEGQVMAMASTAGGIIGSAQTDVTNPYEAIPCGHIYCYVCISTRLQSEEGEGFQCLRCTELIRECKPWAGDVIEEISRPNPGKSVSFADQKDDDASVSDLGKAQSDSGYETAEHAQPVGSND